MNLKIRTELFKTGPKILILTEFDQK